jgi:hypothetical protein
MSPFRRPGAPRRALALLLGSLTITGACTSWHASEVAPQTVLARERPAAVRVTAHDDHRQVLRGPRIAADTLRGLRGWRGKDSVTVALRDVTRVEVQRVSAAKTAALVVVVGGLIAAVIAVGSMNAGLWYCDC